MTTWFFLLTTGLAFWYIYYGAECIINGAMPGWLMPFKCWWLDLKHNLPLFGPQFRLQSANGDQEWADMFPGRWHFFFTNLLLPLFPTLIYLLVNLD